MSVKSIYYGGISLGYIAYLHIRGSIYKEDMDTYCGTYSGDRLIWSVHYIFNN